MANFDFNMAVKEIHDQINEFLSEGKKVFTSSSFQSHSLPLLHIISRLEADIPVYFLNTGFHFSETVKFKNSIAKEFGLTIIDVESPIAKNVQRNSKGHFHFVDKPDYCCYLNKVLPMEPVLMQHDVWIAGVRADQNATRGNMKKTQEGKHGVLRYHPILDWDKKAIWKYIYDHSLPHHPLDAMGYSSIGCEPCTTPSFNMEDDRFNRWQGMKKNECGLHTALANKD